MQVKLAVLADYANVTGDGKLNILGIFDRMTVGELPAVHPQMHLVLRLEAHSGERDRLHTIEIRLQDPDGDIIFDVQGEIVPRGEFHSPVSTNQILTLNNLQLTKIGEFTFLVFVNNDLKAEVPLVVDLGGPEGPMITPPGPMH